MKPIVREYLQNLRHEYEQLSYSEITSFGWMNLEPLELEGEFLKPAVWSDKHEGDTLLVVQLEKEIRLGWKRVDCLGALIDKSGEIVHVDEKWLIDEFSHP